MQSRPVRDSLARYHFTQLDVWDYREDLQNLAHYLCEDPEGACRSLQAAVRKMDTFRGEASVRGWLHRVATNECRSIRGRDPGDIIEEHLDDAVDGRSSPREAPAEELGLELEIRRGVLDGLAALPDTYRCALLLKDGHGLTVAQSARLMSTTPAAIRSVLYRARQALRGSVQA
jgi:RNA polymerase sigma-70 factor, ECF subfamily